ncbi:dual OB domain-containing protein [Occallatibacter savannae]|uniref:dual OB domain-containing protein n=1 Tax=Occallatibacter savannae TaxID=1002691 RepID=UPI000D69F38D
MSLTRIVCLANSYKHDHRCVAGIDLRTKQWVRLVGNSIPGCMTLAEASYVDGTPLRLLDVFEVELAEPCGTDDHPEDVRVSRGAIFFSRKFNGFSDCRLLAGVKAKAGQVLQGYRDRVFADPIRRNSPCRSLELIRPDDLWWWIRNDGKRKSRALFRSNRTRFDLAVTDPEWLEKLAPLEPGIYPHGSFFSRNAQETYLTISMSEPFERFRYKLVAGVISARASGGFEDRA